MQPVQVINCGYMKIRTKQVNYIEFDKDYVDQERWTIAGDIDAVISCIVGY